MKGGGPGGAGEVCELEHTVLYGVQGDMYICTCTVPLMCSA